MCLQKSFHMPSDLAGFNPVSCLFVSLRRTKKFVCEGRVSFIAVHLRNVVRIALECSWWQLSLQKMKKQGAKGLFRNIIIFLHVLIASLALFPCLTAVVTTTTATTVVQVPYPQQPGMPPQGYPVGMYQGYNPLPVQPQQGMPAAPYPTQYPPPYPTQPAGPPPYHETMAGKERIC